jgi:2-keto-4-pentenoate hydratase/2-oxohepta-3-ene-1,7-dioic acid hydratase in catechol pathway
MKLGSLLWKNRPALGILAGNRVLVASELGESEADYRALAGAADVLPLFSTGGQLLIAGLAERISRSGIPASWDRFCTDAATCEWLPPVTSPEKIICIGLNYRDHAAESQMQLPKEPVFFNKYNSALTGAAGPVILPSNSVQVDYEAELAVVIGKAAKRVSETEAWKSIGGYTVMHDVSARDWQFRTGQWVAGKTFDTFAPCGPWMVTPDEVPDPHGLDIQLTLNGAVLQKSNTRHLIFSIPTLISYLSNIFTLKPGDIISTGTPSGVGFARKPQVFLKDGDVVEITVAGVGTQRHRCTAEQAATAQPGGAGA